MPQDTAAPPLLHFAPFVLDRSAGRLLRDGKPVDLAPRPFAVLAYLAERSGQLVSKDELLDTVWGHRHVSDSVLKVAMNGLRGALGDDAQAPRFIETAARRGYRFVAAVHMGDSVGDSPDGSADLRADVSAESSDNANPNPPANPPAATPVPALGNLPALTSPLVGRDGDLAALRALLQTHRLVTLLGPGGVGKTHLAIAAAHLDAPPDGVWLVRLDALADATPLLDTIARALSLGANAGRSVETLAHALAPLAVRIVLDNAEHLIDALVPLAALCLGQAPQVQLLLTSQTPLRVSGEALLPLQPLAVPPAETAANMPAFGLTFALTFPAVELFITRVKAAQPQFTPDAQTTADIAALCRLLDGLPLAIELAAARVPLLGTAGVLARISDRFALLSRGARDAPQRHRTLRDALEWSFGLLGADERRVLQRLSVFAGSFTPAMAAAVVSEPGAADWQLLDALQALQEQSLLALDTAHATPRLRLLESVRALAAEQLRAAGEEAATQLRLAHAMCDRFKAAQAQYTRTPLLHWLLPLRPEADNLRVALSCAMAALPTSPAAAVDAAPPAPEPGALRLAIELVSQAMLFWLRSGRKREAQRSYEALAPCAVQLHSADLRAQFGLAVGALAAYGQALPPAQALPWLDEAEALFAKLGDGRSAMLALYLNAALSQRVAPTQDRTPLLLRMRALEQPDWSPRERNFAAWTQAVNAHGHGDLLAFKDFCVDDLARARAGDDHAEAWVAAFGLGQALWTLGEQAPALAVLGSAVEDLRASGLLREYATTAALAAGMRVALGTVEEGEAAAREAADLLRAEGMLWWLGDALMTLPARRGQWPAALRLQRWMDEKMRALGVTRSPVASSLRAGFDVVLEEARAGANWQEPDAAPSDENLVLDDAEVLRLSFG